MVSSIESSVGTERKVVTELPGPKSRALHERRKAVVSAGLTTGFPIYIERGEGAIVVDVDGNRILDLGSGIAVTTIGHAVPEVIEAVSAQVAAFTHTCFMVAPYESYVTVCEELEMCIRDRLGDGCTDSSCELDDTRRLKARVLSLIHI